MCLKLRTPVSTSKIVIFYSWINHIKHSKILYPKLRTSIAYNLELSNLTLIISLVSDQKYCMLRNMVSYTPNHCILKSLLLKSTLSTSVSYNQKLFIPHLALHYPTLKTAVSYTYIH